MTEFKNPDTISPTSTPPTTKVLKKKVLLSLDKGLLQILDIILKQEHWTRNAFVNGLIKDYIRLNKEKIQAKLNVYRDSLNTPLDPSTPTNVQK